MGCLFSDSSNIFRDATLSPPLKQRTDPGGQERRKRHHDDLSNLLLPVKPKVVIPGTALGFREIMLEEVRFRDEDKIQADNIKRLDAEQDNQKPHKELCKCIASLYTIPAAINDHADKAEHAQDHAYPAEYRGLFRMADYDQSPSL